MKGGHRPSFFINYTQKQKEEARGSIADWTSMACLEPKQGTTRPLYPTAESLTLLPVAKWMSDEQTFSARKENVRLKCEQ